MHLNHMTFALVQSLFIFLSCVDNLNIIGPLSENDPPCSTLVKFITVFTNEGVDPRTNNHI